MGIVLVMYATLTGCRQVVVVRAKLGVSQDKPTLKGRLSFAHKADAFLIRLRPLVGDCGQNHHAFQVPANAPYHLKMDVRGL
jgi:hypothetical protein